MKELLFYLVSHSSRTKAQIGLALWPDASPKQLRNSLSTTLYHLRRALGSPHWIVFEDDVYRFNRALDYQFDVEVFEANLAQASRLQSHAPDRAITLLQDTLTLYRGDFVEDLLDGEWFLLRREELRRNIWMRCSTWGSCSSRSRTMHSPPSAIAASSRRTKCWRKRIANSCAAMRGWASAARPCAIIRSSSS
ncbi:MAG: hypothetical protein HGB05_11055 [Chloroflexi bacterium]|nr:hypothetical protein [Chloroflexota bacterium]